MPISVSISDDGRKWEKICVLTEGKSYWRIDLSGKTVEARYIRLKRMTESGGKKNPLHLRAILAYGERLE